MQGESRGTSVADPGPFVGGRRVPSHDDRTTVSVNPATGEGLWSVPVGHRDDVDDAVRAARRAFDTGPWRLDADLRAGCLMRLADLIEERSAEIAMLDTLEIGIPLEVTSADAVAVAGIVREIVAMLPEVGADAIEPSVRLPRGVVAVIAPWNFPFFVAVTKVVPVLAVGNTVVLKPTELASASAVLLAEMAHAAGFPAGVLNVVPGDGAVVGDALVRHPMVDQVNLTGSLATGRRVLVASAESTLVPVLTELGGKSAHVVGEHAPDLDTVADAIAASIFWCAGQVCTAGSRLIVVEQHHDELLAKLLDRVEQWTGTDPMLPGAQAGPLGSEAHRRSVHAMVTVAVEEGAELRAGGVPGSGPGFFYPPTILSGVQAHHRVFQDEVFGPVLSITSCRSVEHGIELANDTVYGLAATGWSADPVESRRLASGLRAAWVSVNPHLAPPSDSRVGAESLGSSGSGVEGGLPGLRAATRLAVVAVGGANISTDTQEDHT
jgi:acyl-CoA reductase-like NAD-dependent aldehyde dehydrogenase